MEPRLIRVFPVIALSLSAFAGSHLGAEQVQPAAAAAGPVLNSSSIVSDANCPSNRSGNQPASTCNKWPMFYPNAVRNSNDLWIDGEVLFWKSNMGSLDYGLKSSSSTTINGRVEQPHFDWDWGFRLGLGYKLPHDKWDLFINYTYVQGKAGGSAGSGHGVVYPNWAFNVDSATNFFANYAKAHWSMSLNMADIELGRTCFAGKWLTIRPFMGVRGLVIDQDYNVMYKGGTVAANDEAKVHMDNEYWGVGLRIGADTLWGLGKGFSIYGNGSASLLSGKFDVHEMEKLNNADIQIYYIKNNFSNVVVAADLALGLQWDYMFCKDRFHFGVKLGWEFDMFFDQNQLFNFLGSSPGALVFQNDDLSFQGLTLGFRFDF